MPIFNIHSVFCFNDEIDGLFQPHRFAFLVIDHNRHIMIAKVGTQSVPKHATVFVHVSSIRRPRRCHAGRKYYGHISLEIIFLYYEPT